MQHILLCDSEAVFTDDGDPQPRNSVFVECLDVTCECQGKFILHDNEIAEYIEKSEELRGDLVKLLAEMEEHRERYTTHNAKDGNPYWRGRRDEAGHFRDRLRSLIDKLGVPQKHD